MNLTPSPRTETEKKRMIIASSKKRNEKKRRRMEGRKNREEAKKDGRKNREEEKKRVITSPKKTGSGLQVNKNQAILAEAKAEGISIATSGTPITALFVYKRECPRRTSFSSYLLPPTSYLLPPTSYLLPPTSYLRCFRHLRFVGQA